MKTILVRYAEIALKGANRYMFENKLRKNMQEALEIPLARVRQYGAQYAVQVADDHLEEALERLGKVFGIAWYAPTTTCENTLGEIVPVAVEAAKGKLDSSISFAIRARRSDKTLPFSSVDIERRAGEAVRLATGAGVNLNDPDFTVYVVASAERAYVFTERLPGPGGLPVGTSGRVLSLLSGGFDSVAASYMLAKRGAEVDFLHFHVFPSSKPVMQSPIADIVSELSRYTLSKCLYLASYLPFEFRMLGMQNSEDGYQLVLFRRLMTRVGEALAEKHGYQALVMGDSLGQVASQTMENIISVEEAVSVPIFRPLIGMDKVDITELVRDIGLFEATTAPYKDCCSLIAPHPVIHSYLPRVHSLEREMDMPKIVEEVVDAIEGVAL